MREALMKKRFGVPALLLIAILLTAGSAAAVIISTVHYVTNTAEPLTFRVDDELDLTNQGESDSIMVHVANASKKIGYGIFVNTTARHVESVSYSTENMIVTEPIMGTDFNNDGDKVDAEYNIGPGSSVDIVVTIDTADNADPGKVLVILDFHRKSKY